MAALTDSPASSLQAFPMLHVLTNTIKVRQLDLGRPGRGSHNRVLAHLAQGSGFPHMHRGCERISHSFWGNKDFKGAQGYSQSLAMNWEKQVSFSGSHLLYIWVQYTV